MNDLCQLKNAEYNDNFNFAADIKPLTRPIIAHMPKKAHYHPFFTDFIKTDEKRFDKHNI